MPVAQQPIGQGPPPLLPPPPPPPPPPRMVRIGASVGDLFSRFTQSQLSGGAIGNIQISGNGNGGIVIQPGRNQFGNIFHRTVTSPLVSPPAALLDWLTR